jgi:hypothetical protein
MQRGECGQNEVTKGLPPAARQDGGQAKACRHTAVGSAHGLGRGAARAADFQERSSLALPHTLPSQCLHVHPNRSSAHAHARDTQAGTRRPLACLDELGSAAGAFKKEVQAVHAREASDLLERSQTTIRQPFSS